MPINDSDQLTPLEDLFNSILQEAKDYADALFVATKPHICRAQSSGETLTTGTQTKLSTFGTIVDSGIDISYGSGDWTVAKAGVYNIVGTVAFASNATGDRRAYLYRGGATLAKTTSDANSTTDTVLPVQAQVHLDAGDVISLRAFHSRGSDLATVPSDTRLSISWLHP